MSASGSRDDRTGVAPAIVAVLIGLVAGLGAFTFLYARGASYLTNDPAACANCHIMQEHFDAWIKSSHGKVAVCNDCHAPHEFFGKYATKARNGFWHSFYFTTGGFPDPLRITPANRRVTEGACRDCHAPVVDAIDPAPGAHAGRPVEETMSCIRCHRSVGHWVR
ncbi:MAG TPA: cytochrome c nitrite reductase small subunit [Gemmatimonadales bacterium]|nr:cytochrome c nitrite reductase small subunit [Gemmatimonadales bacterium]